VRNRTGLVEYLRGVWEELKKVVWPGREELLRMTGIVIATVVLFGLLIGGADYLLSLAVRQVYTGAASATPTAAPLTTTQSSAPAVTAPATVPSAATSAGPTPIP
jgi:preprotein translocase subunit SecE